MYSVVCGFKMMDSDLMATMPDEREHVILGADMQRKQLTTRFLIRSVSQIFRL